PVEQPAGWVERAASCSLSAAPRSAGASLRARAKMPSRGGFGLAAPQAREALPPPACPAPAAPAGPPNKDEADSEFELRLDESAAQAAPRDSARGEAMDVFEATDFGVPAIEEESASEAMAPDEVHDDFDDDAESVVRRSIGRKPEEKKPASESRGWLR